MAVDLERIWALNAALPKNVHETIDNIVASTIAAKPKWTAVHAWNGDLTYEKLGELASKLAKQLIAKGIGPECYVPLCFEKSMWTVVAIYGIIKTGGAFVLLDNHLPEERLRNIVKQTRSHLIVSSLHNYELSSRLLKHVVTVGPALYVEPEALPHRGRSTFDPSSPVYVVFTSGSTGVPKGCVISHQNLCSALNYQLPHLGITSTSRIFDYASYSFDVAIHNIFAALVLGGCICIPHESDRMNDLAHSINEMQATVVNLTPTVARLLDLKTVPSLETLILLGEKVTYQDSRTWWSTAQLINAYGPSECTSLCTINSTASNPCQLESIGIGKGAVIWIVDPNDHNQLLDWGQTGELLIEGPIVGLGYFSDSTKTKEVFVKDPEWLLRGATGIPGRSGRLYKTGDLARYNEDGSIVILGRKDSQVKIRGNRIELGDVEASVRHCVPEARQVVAEAVQVSGLPNSVALVAFMASPTQPSFEVGRSLTHEIFDIGDNVEMALRADLPSYMIPSTFVRVSSIPQTLTGKSDRKLLRQIGAQLLSQRHESSDTLLALPKTAHEHMLREMWSKALNLEVDQIGTHETFFKLGGDSIAAMKLVGEARRHNIKLTVADVFRHPKLVTLATKMIPLEHSSIQASMIMELENESRKEFISQANQVKGELYLDETTGVLPLTDLQESFVVEGLADGRQVVDYYFLDIGIDVDILKLRRTCDQLLQTFPVLRASFPFLEENHWMALPRALLASFHVLDMDTSLDIALENNCLEDRATLDRGLPIAKFVVLRNTSEGSRLVLRLSHAQYDGISIKLIFDAFCAIHHGDTVKEETSFSAFTAYRSRQRPQATVYWQNLLQGSRYLESGKVFAPTITPTSPPQSFRVEKEISLPTTSAGITMASLTSAAWATYLSLILNEEDVVYGQIVSGRNASLPGIERMVGCCINVVPVRANPTAHQTLLDFVQSIQAQYIAMGEADLLGFNEILEECTDWPKGSTLYTCVQYGNGAAGDDLDYQIERLTSRVRRFENPKRLPIFFYVNFLPGQGKLGVQIFAHTHLASPDTAHRVLHEFCPLVTKVAAALDEPITMADFVRGVQIKY